MNRRGKPSRGPCPSKWYVYQEMNRQKYGHSHPLWIVTFRHQVVARYFKHDAAMNHVFTADRRLGI